MWRLFSKSPNNGLAVESKFEKNSSEYEVAVLCESAVNSGGSSCVKKHGMRAVWKFYLR